jgi:hypothetical protein
VIITVPETLVAFNKATRLMAREDFINVEDYTA